MGTLWQRRRGLDVRGRRVVARVVAPGPDGRPLKAVRAFGTVPPASLALDAGLAEHGVTRVARESTGVYCKPVDAVLEATGS